MSKSLKIIIVLVIAILFLFKEEVSGQKKGEIFFGMGFPELMNIGLKYKVFNQFRAGLNAGWLPRTSFKSGSWNDLISFSGDIYYHFGRTSYFSDLRIFYVRIGMNCILQKPFRWSENWWNSCFRVGGEIFSAKKIGITIDGGFIYNHNPETSWARMDRFLPALGTGILYRF